MDWLSDCFTLLTAKDRDSIPEDLTVVEALLHEHAVRSSPFSSLHSLYAGENLFLPSVL